MARPPGCPTVGLEVMTVIGIGGTIVLLPLALLALLFGLVRFAVAAVVALAAAGIHRLIATG